MPRFFIPCVALYRPRPLSGPARRDRVARANLTAEKILSCHFFRMKNPPVWSMDPVYGGNALFGQKNVSPWASPRSSEKKEGWMG